MVEDCPVSQSPAAQTSAVLRRSRAVVRRRAGLFLATFALSLLGVLAGVYIRQPSYESTARLLLESQRKEVSVSRSEVQPDAIQLQAQEALASQAEILQSRELIRQVAERLGDRLRAEPQPQSGLLGALKRAARGVTESGTAALVRLRLLPPLTKEQEILQSLQKSLRVYPVRKAQIIELIFVSKQPELAPLVLNALIELYLEKVSALRASLEEYQVFLAQSAQLQVQLQSAEEEFAAFSVRNQLADLDAEKALLLARLDRLEERRSGKSAARDSGDARGTAPATGGGDQPGSQGAELQSRLQQLRADLARVSLRYGEDHLQVREVQEQIRTLEALLETETRQAAQTVAATRQRLTQLVQLQPEYERLRRQVSIGKDTYEIYRKAAEDRRVGSERSSRIVVQVVDPPVTPYMPRGPSRLTLVLAGFMLSCALAVLAVAFWEWANPPR